MIALKNVAWSEVRNSQNGMNNYRLCLKKKEIPMFHSYENNPYYILWNKYLGLVKAIRKKEIYYQTILTVTDKLKG